MRISDWSLDVFSSDLGPGGTSHSLGEPVEGRHANAPRLARARVDLGGEELPFFRDRLFGHIPIPRPRIAVGTVAPPVAPRLQAVLHVERAVERPEPPRGLTCRVE